MGLDSRLWSYIVGVAIGLYVYWYCHGFYQVEVELWKWWNGKSYYFYSSLTFSYLYETITAL